MHPVETSGLPPLVVKYLRFRPYLDLRWQYDFMSMLREARQLREQFVVHRRDSQRSTVTGAHWRSIALIGQDGDWLKTETPRKYSPGKEEVRYLPTGIAGHCPVTMKFAEEVTKISRCERVRFMLLEPGAEITTHRDSERETNIIMYVALNAPPQCNYFVDVRPNGTLATHSTAIPFYDGSFFLINVARYHRISNHSASDRYSLIVEGPVCIPQNYLIQAATTQNSDVLPEELDAAILRMYVWRNSADYTGD